MRPCRPGVLGRRAAHHRATARSGRGGCSRHRRRHASLPVTHEPGPLLADRVALVTGGGGGIGRAISEAFAAHGARVVVAEINPERAEETVAAIEAAGGEATGVVVDVGDEGA